MAYLSRRCLGVEASVSAGSGIGRDPPVVLFRAAGCRVARPRLEESSTMGREPRRHAAPRPHPHARLQALRGIKWCAGTARINDPLTKSAHRLVTVARAIQNPVVLQMLRLGHHGAGLTYP